MRWLTGFLILPFVLFTPPPSFAIENQECMECHGDESLQRSVSEGMSDTLFLDFDKFKYSVHNVNAVACVDCHASIESLDYDADPPHATATAPVRCVDCHEEEGNVYKTSVHHKMAQKGVTIPCYACHGYHYVTRLEGNTVYERENHFCLKCHRPEKFHDWLPQKETHFAHVECTVCHAPDAPRHIHLMFYDLVRERYLNKKEKLAAFNTDEEHFFKLLDRNGDGILNVAEFEDMVLGLRQKGIRGTFRGELLSEVKAVVHHVNRGTAKRDCENCHQPTSPFFQEVTIILEREDGTLMHQKVERQVLETYYVNHFYALGGTRIRVLDRLGILLPIGGLLIVGAHLTARLVTRGRRTAGNKKQTRG